MATPLVSSYSSPVSSTSIPNLVTSSVLPLSSEAPLPPLQTPLLNSSPPNSSLLSPERHHDQPHYSSNTPPSSSSTSFSLPQTYRSSSPAISLSSVSSSAAGPSTNSPVTVEENRQRRRRGGRKEGEGGGEGGGGDRGGGQRRKVRRRVESTGEAEHHVAWLIDVLHPHPSPSLRSGSVPCYTSSSPGLLHTHTRGRECFDTVERGQQVVRCQHWEDLRRASICYLPGW